MRLYYHKTDGGAEYLCSRAVLGTTEGSLADSKYIVRIDGDITNEAELFGDDIEETDEEEDQNILYGNR